MMIKVIQHVQMDMEQSDQGKGINHRAFCRSKLSREVIDRVYDT
jgi:hypothetical protein